MSIFAKARELATIHSAAAVLGWDQETYLPPAAATHRADQLAWLSARAHELATSPEWQRALTIAEENDDGSDPKRTANLRLLRRDFNRASCLPVALVEQETTATSLAKHAWAKARETSDFSSFAPHLETIVQIARQKADLWGFQNEPYDALLETYERGATTRQIANLFDEMSPALRDIAAAAVAKSATQPAALPAATWPVQHQQKLNAQIAAAIGFDFSTGRIDTTAHPFCTTLGPHDVRLTTRYDATDFTSSLFGVLHECGHGLYELGLPPNDFGLPSGHSVSLGIHESQSRLWENHVGRSPEFWQIWYPAACEIFPALAALPLDSFLAYLHRSAFSPIRVEADEATYDLHIILRFSLERRLISGSLAVKDIPAAWNDEFHASFGFFPPDDAHGCLQDIHWALGGIGYFATYTLGNINAAQLFSTAQKNPSIATAMIAGNYAPLLAWLRENIHSHGAIHDSRTLIANATGQPPSPADYLDHLRHRYI